MAKVPTSASAAPRGRAPRPVARGVSLVELLIVLAILGIALLFAVPAWLKVARRLRLQSCATGVTRALNSARLQAIRRGVPVVVAASTDSSGRIQLDAFADPNVNLVRDAGEPVVESYTGEVRVPFWSQPAGASGKGDLSTAVPFDYGATEALKHRVAFLATGALSPPAASGIPSPTGGRGLYFADEDGLNFFRVTIYSDLTGKPVLEKWVGSAYTTTGWIWR